MSPIAQAILDGKIFIYPTDTIYGIGCDATNEASVARIREIKQRDGRPFGVIPPSSDWIKEHVGIDPNLLTPGPFTYFATPENQACVAKSLRPDGSPNDSLGLRMSEHWFTRYVAEAGVPFVSTSVNISGAPHMTSLADLDPTIREAADIIIYDGPAARGPSTKVNLNA